MCCGSRMLSSRKASDGSRNRVVYPRLPQRGARRQRAEELNLDIDQEHDLVAVAQYHFNENGGNRHVLNQTLIEQLTVGAAPTNNHQILARLPISTYWTTNYDNLIETALKDAGKLDESSRSP